MKKLLIIFSVYTLIGFTSAQTDDVRQAVMQDSVKTETTSQDSVNIRDIVQKQIEEARTKQAQVVPQKEQPVATPAVQEEKETVSLSGLDFLVNKTGLSKSTAVKLSVLMASSVFILSFVFARRRAKNKKRLPLKRLKRNVKALREEKVFLKKEDKLKEIRRKLSGDPVLISSYEKDLNVRAQELKISKGEMILAAKIKSHELAKGSLYD